MSNLPRILSLLESFRGKKQVQAYLQSKNLPFSGTWDTVRTKIEHGVSTGQISERELTDLLEDIEEHGDQYVFLYDIDLRKSAGIESRANFEKLLTDREKEKTLDKVAIIEKPSTQMTLVSALYNSERTIFRSLTREPLKLGTETPPAVEPTKVSPTKLKWVQKRSFRQPLDETISGDIATVRYQIISTRAVDLAILDLSQRRATLCLQKIEPGIRDYRKQLKELLDRVARFIDPSALKPLDLVKLMKAISDKQFYEVRRRRYRAMDASGGLIDVTSATETTDIYSGGLYEAGRDHYAGAIASVNANVYWTGVPRYLDREIHTVFPYKQAVNAVIFMQRCTKTEREYVLSRIESIASGKP